MEEHDRGLPAIEIAELFQTTKQNISLHAKNIPKDGELIEDSVVKESLTTAADGKSYRTKLYNLNLILAIVYRVRSPRGVQFRQWASTHLKQYLVKGFVMDDQRLKNPGARIADVVRTHPEIFSDIRPATSMVEVRRLITPEILVEIEADAYIGE